jgi:hypothetical protein
MEEISSFSRPVLEFVRIPGITQKGKRKQQRMRERTLHNVQERYPYKIMMEPRDGEWFVVRKSVA